MKRRAPAIGREALASEIASLSKFAIDELRERWKARFGKAPSREIGRSFLIRAIGYRLQEKAFGGLKPSTHRRERRGANHRSNVHIIHLLLTRSPIPLCDQDGGLETSPVRARRILPERQSRHS